MQLLAGSEAVNPRRCRLAGYGDPAQRPGRNDGSALAGGSRGEKISAEAEAAAYFFFFFTALSAPAFGGVPSVSCNVLTSMVE
jgi:hypothetical protein